MRGNDASTVKTGLPTMAEASARRKRVELWADFFDPIAVEIVSIVTDHLGKDGKLYAYDGIEAARSIRKLLAEKITAAELEV